MKSFSERLGLLRPVVVDEAPDWLRTAIFNSVLGEFLGTDRGKKSSWSNNSFAVIGLPDFIEEIALRTQREVDPIYLRPFEARAVLGNLLLVLSWTEFYGVLEVFYGLLREGTPSLAILYQKLLNEAFRKGNVAWQMKTGGELVRSLPADVVAVETELQGAPHLGEAPKLHLRKARKFLDDRPCDSANAVKESISAIESFVRSQPGSAQTLGKTLNAWKRDGHAIPALLVSAIEKLYAFVSDEAGVRHGSPKEERLVRDDAEFVYLLTLALMRYLGAVEGDVDDRIGQ